MSTSKHLDKICIVAISLTLVITVLLMCVYPGTEALAATVMEYESSLFDTSFVHTINIEMDDWDSFIESCENEEYSLCSITVDGKEYNNVAIRAKGNTSLSSVKSLGSERYSFKLEFDHYQDNTKLDGLDKLCLNNLIQDNTMMKDYIAYTLMNEFDVDSPLCSFVYVTVNGEDWGLYLAVEGIEDSFLERNYGTESGDLYKPDSMSFGGGRGNGKDFDMDNFDFSNTEVDENTTKQNGNNSEIPSGLDKENFKGQTPPNGTGEKMTPPSEGEKMTPPSNGGQFPGAPETTTDDTTESTTESTLDKTTDDKKSFGGGMNGGGMGSDDVKLKYIDDSISSYSNIFDNAKTKVTSSDKKRLISSLKQLSSYENVDEVVNTDEVMRYFVVHNFLCNGDSYTGSMIHNYYLYESDGKLSMIPWDYNLAFGTFQGGSASSAINADIDNPVSNGTVDDRPMLGWIFSSDEYTNEYHKLFSEFIEKWFTNGELEELISSTAEMIRPYVEKDPTKFCTTEEFDSAISTLSQFVDLRSQAITQQLSGNTTAVDTGDLNLSNMGTMNNGGGKNQKMEMPQQNQTTK